ncbi:hypothetical protein COU59_00615 [Candidatus Pacearchaeota archaeon CG10_big_fil_rev_8_21_14_0_10_34_12]|nr:MAG: hypothetical protein COU59_00615 [Candidatus Pacearchaeota archaeon CG10_big_fil_rev_8_21_14_0_10_34_12]
MTIVLIILFLLGLLITYWIGFKSGAFKKQRQWELELPTQRKDAIMKSRAILGGQFSEQLAPFLPDFNFNPTELKFLGKPVDFIAFKGLDNKEIEEVVFLEIKSGKSALNKTQKSLKDAIEKKKVRWEEYKIPRELTEKKEK